MVMGKEFKDNSMCLDYKFKFNLETKVSLEKKNTFAISLSKAFVAHSRRLSHLMFPATNTRCRFLPLLFAQGLAKR